MKIKTSEAASRLGIHPLNLLLKLFPMVGSIEDCWPDLDEGYVDTIRTLGEGAQRPTSQPAARLPEPPPEQPPADPLAGIDRGSVRVLEKLWRKDRWGGRAVAWETLHNHYCQDVDNLEEAVEELVQRGLVIKPEKHGPFSLDPSRKGEIERIVRASLGQSS